jgi:hypothetical protein
LPLPSQLLLEHPHHIQVANLDIHIVRMMYFTVSLTIQDTTLNPNCLVYARILVTLTWLMASILTLFSVQATVKLIKRLHSAAKLQNAELADQNLTYTHPTPSIGCPQHPLGSWLCDSVLYLSNQHSFTI